MYIIHTIRPPLDLSKPTILIKTWFLWAWQNPLGYGRKVHAKFWPWGMPGNQSYDYFCVPCCHPTCKSLLIDFPNLARWPSPGLIFDLLLLNRKSNDRYTSSGGLTFCEFVDYRCSVTAECSLFA